MSDVNTDALNGGLAAGGGRRLYAILGAVLFLFLGLLYAWSVFMPPLESEFGWTRAETALVFSICMSFFFLGSLTAGLLSRRKSPRFILAFAALCMGSGFFLTSRGNSLLALYLSYGGLGGFGVGMAYNVLLSTMLKWFPDKPGRMSGFMLMGFGAGALALGPLCSWLVAEVGWRGVFLGLSGFYTLLYLVAACRLAPPPPGLSFPPPSGRWRKAVESGGEVPTGEMARRASFKLLFAWASCMAAAGYILISHAVPLAISEGLSPALAAALAGLISLCNGLGRVIGGLGFDLLGRKTVMRAASCGYLLCALLLFLSLETGSRALLVAVFALTGFCLGCSILTNAALIRTFYGLDNYSLNYGILSFSTVIAAFTGPYVTGVLHTLTGSYAAAPFCMLALGGAALAAALALKKP